MDEEKMSKQIYIYARGSHMDYRIKPKTVGYITDLILRENDKQTYLIDGAYVIATQNRPKSCAVETYSSIVTCMRGYRLQMHYGLIQIGDGKVVRYDFADDGQITRTTMKGIHSNFAWCYKLKQKSLNEKMILKSKPKCYSGIFANCQTQVTKYLELTKDIDFKTIAAHFATSKPRYQGSRSKCKAHIEEMLILDDTATLTYKPKKEWKQLQLSPEQVQSASRVTPLQVIKNNILVKADKSAELREVIMRWMLASKQVRFTIEDGFMGAVIVGNRKLLKITREEYAQNGAYELYASVGDINAYEIDNIPDDGKPLRGTNLLIIDPVSDIHRNNIRQNAAGAFLIDQPLTALPLTQAVTVKWSSLFGKVIQVPGDGDCFLHCVAVS